MTPIESLRKKKILVYCQHLFGIGHVTTALAISKELLKKNFSVDFIHGGAPLGLTIDHFDFYHHYLNPLRRDEITNLITPIDPITLEESLFIRASQLNRIVKGNSYDALIIEMFPFGRFKLKQEILSLIESVRKSNPQIKVLCSYREIHSPRPDQKERNLKILRILKEHFDYLYIHSDPSCIRFNETFELENEIPIPMLYTGFVTEITSKSSQSQNLREPMVLVSAGGGAYGQELISATLKVVKLLPKIKFVFSPGMNLPMSARKELSTLQNKLKNLYELEDFALFETYLKNCGLSLSAGGYRTMTDLCASRTPALIYPYRKDLEQEMRANRFLERGLINVVLTKEDLEPSALKYHVESNLLKTPTGSLPNLNGTTFCANHLNAILS